ncbi:hypothetical protein [Tahibacter caeni]|uniref:hypothetical protein n=1 Tax=Tahibacter caeni TaxID=1453545 RepID=UPI002148D4C9|nr:hypothetical protein [Tahibacter caeni]
MAPPPAPERAPQGPAELSETIGSAEYCDVTAQPEALVEFARKCDAAIGRTVPAFDCDDPEATAVPEGTETPGPNCDFPNVLNGVCDPGSRFHRLVQTPDVTIVAHCRKQGLPSRKYGDVAVIQYNRLNGATCFYQALGVLDAAAPAPSDPAGRYWKEPIETAGINCVRCHDNGPFVRSPYLAQLRDDPKNALPGTHPGSGPWEQRFSWNKTLPYKFIGANFQSWKVYSIAPETPGRACTVCHRMGLSSTEAGFDTRFGTSLKLGPTATAAMQSHKNPHSAASPIWMKPGQTTYVKSVEEEALDVQRCAQEVARYGNNPVSGPPPAECRWTQYGQGNTCKTPVKIPVNDPPTGIPDPGPTGGEVPVPTCPPGTPDCPVGFCYWAAVHGPFWQRSDGSVPFDDPRYSGSFLRFFADGGQWKARWYSNPMGGPPQIAPGGVLECVGVDDIEKVPDPTACFGSPFQLVERDGANPDSRIEVSIAPNPMNAISGLIGNVSQANGDGYDHVRLSESAGRFFLGQRHTTTPPPPLVPGAMTAEAWGYGCNAWKPDFIVKDAYTTTDTLLVPAASAKNARCFLTGISGAWSTTRSGGAVVPRAEIYTTPGKDIRLRALPASPDADHVGAWASCIRI